MTATLINTGRAPTPVRDEWRFTRTLIFVFYSLVGIGGLHTAPVLSAYTPTLVFQIAMGTAGVGALVILQREYHPIDVSLPLLGYFAVGLLTLAWSTDQPNSLRDLTASAVWGVVALLSLAGMDVDARRDALRWLARILLVGDLAACLVFAPITVGVVDAAHFTDFDVAGWRGFFVHKNPFGISAALFTLVLVGLERRFRVKVVVAVLGTFLVYMSQSATAMGALVVGTIVFVALRPRVRTRASQSTYFALLLSTVAALAVLSPWLFGVALRLLGKDPTLTGRVEIWRLALRLIGERPIGGYGLVPFGSGANLELDQRVGLTLGFVVNHAHNGVLNCLVQTGLIGLVCVLALVVPALWRTGRRAMHGRDVYLFAAFAAFVTASGSESIFSLPFLVLVPILMSAEVRHPEERR